MSLVSVLHVPCLVVSPWTRRLVKVLTLHSVYIALAGGCTDFEIRHPLQVAFCEGRCLGSGIEYNTTVSDNTALDDAAYSIW